MKIIRNVKCDIKNVKTKMNKNVITEQNTPPMEYLVMFGIILTLLSTIAIMVHSLINIRRENEYLNKVFGSSKSYVDFDFASSNNLFTDSEQIDFVGIGLENRRKTYFDLLENDLKDNDIKLQYFEAVNGKKLNMKDYNLAPRYIHFFENNIKERESGKTKKNYKGHLGCTISHLTVIQNIQRMTCILEDDADIVPNFRSRLQHSLAAVTDLDPDWELLVLGFSAKYTDHYYHKLNDVEPIVNGIAKLHYWIGGWAYIIRNKKVAKKILTFFNQISWHIDITLAEQTRSNNLNTYGVVPSICNHPGFLRQSSFDHNQYGDPSKMKTDTNT